MSNVTNIPAREPSILEQARAEVAKEQAEKAKGALKKLLRDRAAAEAVLKGIDLQIADVEQQIADGTL
jgi:hypothetical protein